MSSDGWMSWALKNATPERLQSAMGVVKDNLDADDLNKLAELAKKNEGLVKDVKDAINTEIKEEIPAGTSDSGTLKSKWTSWMRSKADAAPPAPPPTSTRQKYLRLAVKHWRYTAPVAMWLASSFWWIIAIVVVISFLKKKKKTA